MSAAPFFSIVIPTYNRAKLIAKAIDSVLQQTFAAWELIVVDDGSKDNTKHVVEEFGDKRIKYVYQQNQERSAARNNGIKHATGKYICFVDSDDYYLPQRLQLLHDTIKAKGEPVALFYTNICFDRNGVITDMPVGGIENGNVHDFLCTARLGNPQICAARHILIKHPFNPKFRIGEDMEMLHRALDEFEAIYVPNQFTVVAGDHDDRSVNEKRNNSFAEQKLTIDYIFSHNHPGSKTSPAIKGRTYSNCYFGIARYYIYNRKTSKAVFWLLKSIYALPQHVQTKYKINIIRNLLFNPSEAEKLLA